MILNFCNSVVIKLIKMYFPPIPKIQSSKNLQRIKISQFFYRGIFVQDVRSAGSVSLGCSYCCVCLLWNLFPFLKNHRTLCVALALLLALQIQVKIFQGKQECHRWSYGDISVLQIYSSLAALLNWQICAVLCTSLLVSLCTVFLYLSYRKTCIHVFLESPITEEQNWQNYLTDLFILLSLLRQSS